MMSDVTVEHRSGNCNLAETRVAVGCVAGFILMML